METFKNDDDGYLKWHSAHEIAFVLNRFGGTNPAYNVLHRSTCPFLWREADENARTVIEKWCSTSEGELTQQADAVLGEGMWKRCGVCFRSSTNEKAQPVAYPQKHSSSFEHPGSVWIPGEPAAWVSTGEKEWKQLVTSALNESVSPLPGFKWTPEWLDIELRLLEDRLYRKDLDNMLTPLLAAARDAGWLERGFNRLGSVTARKVAVSDVGEVGALITPHSSLPQFDKDETGVLIKTELNSLDESSVKWTLYDCAFDLCTCQPELRFPPLSPLSIDIRVVVNDDDRRKSIQALMKPCIDGLEPILGHPDNLPPVPREQLRRRLAPQDEMVLSLAIHVRGGISSGIAVRIRQHQEGPLASEE